MLTIGAYFKPDEHMLNPFCEGGFGKAKLEDMPSRVDHLLRKSNISQCVSSGCV